MFARTKYFFYAVATLIGYIVGAGIFGVPFVMQSLGFIPALILMLVISGFTVINLLSLTEVILRTRGNHFLPGLANVYQGKAGKWFQFAAAIIGNYGALLAYLVLGGIFLKNLASPWLEFCPGVQEYFFVLLFCALGILFIWRGSEELGLAEFIMLAILIAIVLLIAFKSAPQIQAQNYLGINPNHFLPAFGVFIFALDGLGCIFIVKQILKKRERLIKKTVLITYGIVSLIFFCFAASLVGVFGQDINQEAIIGIGQKLGQDIEFFATIFGFLAIFSSFVVIGSSLKNTLETDFKIPHSLSWLMVWTAPLILYFLGFNNFIEIIALIGIVFGTINTLVIAGLLKKARQEKKRKPEFTLGLPLWINYSISFIYFIAMIYEISRFMAFI
ncbi:MAG: aromatic amino acid transport family protein [Patescibacteria group bacterium]|nr:hypothetical protein [Patescibacteria group bacterium]